MAIIAIFLQRISLKNSLCIQNKMSRIAGHGQKTFCSIFMTNFPGILEKRPPEKGSWKKSVGSWGERLVCVVCVCVHVGWDRSKTFKNSLNPSVNFSIILLTENAFLRIFLLGTLFPVIFSRGLFIRGLFSTGLFCRELFPRTLFQTVC